MAYGSDEEKVSMVESDTVQEDHSRDMSYTRSHRFFLLAGSLIVTFWFLLGHFSDNGTIYTNGFKQGSTTDSLSTDEVFRRVPLEAHIMSQCPDARDCLQDLVVPAMESVSDKVLFNLSFIGS